jgi:hypothetical protein
MMQEPIPTTVCKSPVRNPRREQRRRARKTFVSPTQGADHHHHRDTGGHSRHGRGALRDQDSIDHALCTLTGRILDDFRCGVMVMDERHAAWRTDRWFVGLGYAG